MDRMNKSKRFNYKMLEDEPALQAIAKVIYNDEKLYGKCNMNETISILYHLKRYGRFLKSKYNSKVVIGCMVDKGYATIDMPDINNTRETYYHYSVVSATDKVIKLLDIDVGKVETDVPEAIVVDNDASAVDTMPVETVQTIPVTARIVKAVGEDNIRTNDQRIVWDMLELFTRSGNTCKSSILLSGIMQVKNCKATTCNTLIRSCVDADIIGRGNGKCHLIN